MSIGQLLSVSLRGPDSVQVGSTFDLVLEIRHDSDSPFFTGLGGKWRVEGGGSFVEEGDFEVQPGDTEILRLPVDAQSTGTVSFNATLLDEDRNPVVSDSHSVEITESENGGGVTDPEPLPGPGDGGGGGGAETIVMLSALGVGGFVVWRALRNR